MMPITIAIKRKKPDTIRQNFPDTIIIDVTSKGDDQWVKFSPFYPHGDIPVPFSPDYVSASVEGIWQGLKVFETTDVDVSKFEVTTMHGLKRTVRKYGSVLGHRKGVDGDQLLAYRDARYQIYLPSYQWVLENYLAAEIKQLATLSQDQHIILLDYETNVDIDNLTKPLSHAALIQKYLNDDL
jgi:hypothetical protein